MGLYTLAAVVVKIEGPAVHKAWWQDAGRYQRLLRHALRQAFAEMSWLCPEHIEGSLGPLHTHTRQTLCKCWQVRWGQDTQAPHPQTWCLRSGGARDLHFTADGRRARACIQGGGPGTSTLMPAATRAAAPPSCSCVHRSACFHGVRAFTVLACRGLAESVRKGLQHVQGCSLGSTVLDMLLSWQLLRGGYRAIQSVCVELKHTRSSSSSL